mmetsp:Transcript_127499/g.302968  ORF Transcript_127499/g.302968 Transcript_127499/m.302968 type:complete len:219 (-) Transcript_127499:1854-2510(-)
MTSSRTRSPKPVTRRARPATKASGAAPRTPPPAPPARIPRALTRTVTPMTPRTPAAQARIPTPIASTALESPTRRMVMETRIWFVRGRCSDGSSRLRSLPSVRERPSGQKPRRQRTRRRRRRSETERKRRARTAVAQPLAASAKERTSPRSTLPRSSPTRSQRSPSSAAAAVSTARRTWRSCRSFWCTRPSMGRWSSCTSTPPWSLRTLTTPAAPSPP